ncbi:hypothetical protein [Leptolyngbya sp. FACHB-261]|uniref:hypothetical protein n=1 Tax=Leptolyngbya sp. FACHB-261 TaxID=2692806 RepID=UPI0016837EA1|nr:hypothetical protein [Leptolyngbya sp. FACHB-261]MBD2103265.1 hypothetical protein [Leptolyngbya sp. FACHB-261]
MHIVVLVLVEVLIVISLSRLVGLAFRWIRQPLVIGEIVAGIMLGPSLCCAYRQPKYATGLTQASNRLGRFPITALGSLAAQPDRVTSGTQL